MVQVEVTRLESDTWAESEVNKVEEFVNFINSELASELAWPCRELVGWYMEDRRDVAETDKRCGNFIVISNRVYEKCKLVNRILKTLFQDFMCVCTNRIHSDTYCLKHKSHC